MNKKIKQGIGKVSVAMGLMTSLMNPNSHAAQQADVQSLIQQVKQTSEILTHQNVDEQYFFSVLAQLNETVEKLNRVVREMAKAEKVVADLTFIDTGLNTLAEMIRQKHFEFLKTHLSAREVFKNYTAEVFKFSVFTEKMREKANHYAVVPSQANFNQADLDELVANSQKWTL